MRTGAKEVWVAGILMLLAVWPLRAAEDGLGTNILDKVKVEQIEIGGEVRTNWPSYLGSIGGGPLDYTVHSNEVSWSSVFRWTGTLGKLQVQVDEGYADVVVVRSKWNDSWGTYDTLNIRRATTAGVEDSTWDSSWVSNDYRIGVIVTNFSTGTNLWWSITYNKE